MSVLKRRKVSERKSPLKLTHPDVVSAVVLVLDAYRNAAAPSEDSEYAREARENSAFAEKDASAPEKPSRSNRVYEAPAAPSSAVSLQRDEAGEPLESGNAHLVKLPPIEAMRAAGYQESKDAMKRLWAWAKQHEPRDAVWPTPVQGEQEALAFDACGWPTQTSTPEEWLAMLQYWTVLREQLIGGAPRRARKVVTKQLDAFEQRSVGRKSRSLG
mmetsp:Transcript_32260/g.53304  ORF Transcript_32260/g.53304 Transcript_32260/m.53304 type:complete len:215 (-) Transcript_32260:290-934(-)|eukprot:CAMPEP_0119317522 /NCGR_PEP_ID=MMETSP1333-20130426/43378_1 /TAXON_ID=418940 /ORGANISM="Scyphosphaera apsteinii, Strain RCC1455" /LENGTH=214 /DNA_ID=CAMNT_0007323469 /DNA_START=42 /DNA_END=686 /DNA_ORIENTATION=-